MEPRIWAANSLWFGSLLPKAGRFRLSMGRLEETQARLLRGYLSANARTDYGCRHDFAAIASSKQYQDAVPLSSYDDYLEEVHRIGRGDQNVLTAEPVRLFEPSSGSTAASKLIPYTGSLKAEFERAIAPWIVDLFSRYPGLLGGRAYWSITPLTEGTRRTFGGIPIGFEEDSAYLGAAGRTLVDSVLAVPGAVKGIEDVDVFRYATLLFLLRDPSLRLISVWNPTYLELLLKPMAGWWNQLREDIARGGINPPGDLDPAVRAQLTRRLTPYPARSDELGRVAPDDYRAIWRRLTLLSCWADGPSQPYAARLATLFPGVPLQPKGLIATEAFVTLPLAAAPAPVLAAQSHFFEFLPADGGRPLLAHEIEIGRIYGVVVTTGGGFYRYQLRDLVEIVDSYRGLPCLRFLGKTDQLSDWFGEKLEEGFVVKVVAEVMHPRGCSPAFVMLAPDDGPKGTRYVLYLEVPHGDLPVAALAQDLDRALRTNFHYDYCRRLGQLAAADVVLLRSGAQQVYLDACRERGQRLGNIKPPLLQKSRGWSQRLEGLRYRE